MGVLPAVPDSSSVPGPSVTGTSSNGKIPGSDTSSTLPGATGSNTAHSTLSPPGGIVNAILPPSIQSPIGPAMYCAFASRIGKCFCFDFTSTRAIEPTEKRSEDDSFAPPFAKRIASLSTPPCWRSSSNSALTPGISVSTGSATASAGTRSRRRRSRKRVIFMARDPRGAKPCGSARARNRSITRNYTKSRRTLASNLQDEQATRDRLGSDVAH